eukprot:gene2834-5362_t
MFARIYYPLSTRRKFKKLFIDISYIQNTFKPSSVTAANPSKGTQYAFREDGSEVFGTHCDARGGRGAGGSGGICGPLCDAPEQLDTRAGATADAGAYAVSSGTRAGVGAYAGCAGARSGADAAGVLNSMDPSPLSTPTVLCNYVSDSVNDFYQNDTTGMVNQNLSPASTVISDESFSNLPDLNSTDLNINKPVEVNYAWCDMLADMEEAEMEVLFPGDFRIQGVAPRAPGVRDGDRYSASGQTANINDRFVAACSKVRLGANLFPKPVTAERFPMVTRVVVEVQDNEGIIEEVSEFLRCMGHNADARVLGTRRKRVIASGVEPVAAVVLSGMTMQLSGGAVVFTAGEAVQIRAAQSELVKVAPLAQWRARMIRDAEHMLIRRWGGQVVDGPPDTDSDDGKAGSKMTGPSPPQQPMVKVPAGRGQGLNVSASAAAASPDRQEKLLGKAVEAVMRKARDLGGLDQHKLADLERCMREHGDVSKVRAAANTPNKTTFAAAVN